MKRIKIYLANSRPIITKWTKSKEERIYQFVEREYESLQVDNCIVPTSEIVKVKFLKSKWFWW